MRSAMRFPSASSMSSLKSIGAGHKSRSSSLAWASRTVTNEPHSSAYSGAVGGVRSNTACWSPYLPVFRVGDGDQCAGLRYRREEQVVLDAHVNVQLDQQLIQRPLPLVAIQRHVGDLRAVIPQNSVMLEAPIPPRRRIQRGRERVERAMNKADPTRLLMGVLPVPRISAPQARYRGSDFRNVATDSSRPSGVGESRRDATGSTPRRLGPRPGRPGPCGHGLTPWIVHPRRGRIRGGG